MTKSGYGTLSMGCGNTFRELIVKEGSVNVSAENLEDQLPQTVTLAGGKVTGSNSENNEIVNTSDFIVPEGYEGTFIGSYRGKYTGTLTGNGTFYVYSGGVRCYWEGDWSEFKGTVNVLTTNRQAKPTYTPTFDFRNAYGLPEATLNVAEGATVSNNGKDFPIGTLKGSGTLNGSGNYILGENGKSFTLSTPINAPVIKRGDGRMSMTKVGILNGTLTVDGGKVSFNDSKLATLVNGENTIIVNDGGMIFGQGLVNSLTIYAGGQLTPPGRTSPKTM